MSGEFVIGEPQIEAAAGSIFKTYLEGGFLYHQIICPESTSAHAVFTSFRRQIENNTLPNDFIVEVSEDRLDDIYRNPIYQVVRESDNEDAFALSILTALQDNAQILGISLEEFNRSLKAKELESVRSVMYFLTLVQNKNPNKRAVIIYDDFVDTITRAKELDYQVDLLPRWVLQKFYNEILEESRISVIGFTRPNKETVKMLREVSPASLVANKSINYLQKQMYLVRFIH